ncbi:MAG: type VII toxin-antitoxin system MntA family adenylyltransferase antitoxin [Burkholderiales bacterium]|jgi:predicted nucleotidyltransferase
MDLTELLERLRPRLAIEPGLACAWLFGSQARQQAGAHSDVDVALLYSADPPRTLEASGFLLADELTEATGLPVQVVIANHAPVDLMHRVLRDGVLIVDADKAARVRFEVLTRNRWWDLKPLLDQIRGAKSRSGASAVDHG